MHVQEISDNIEKMSLQYWTSIVFGRKADSALDFPLINNGINSQYAMIDDEIEASGDYTGAKGTEFISESEKIFHEKGRKIYFTKGKWCTLFL